MSIDINKKEVRIVLLYRSFFHNRNKARHDAYSFFSFDNSSGKILCFAKAKGDIDKKKPLID